MSRRDALDVLAGAPGVAYGLTWVPADALRVLTWQESDSDPAETLAAVALELRLDVVLVPAREFWAADAVRLLREADVAVAWAVSGVFGRVAEPMGWSEALKRSASEPGALAFLLSEVLHDALDQTRAGVALGVDALMVADDLAGGTGWLVSPDFALEALMPCYRQIAAEAPGVPHVFHSDGDVRALYPALARAGFSAVHVAGVPEAAQEACARAAHAAGLAVLGGVGAHELMALGAGHTGRHAAALAAAGSTIICDDGGITTAEELAAYVSALDGARKALER